MLALIQERGPLTARELTELSGKHRKAIESTIRYAKRRKLIHISGYQRNFGTKGREAPIYGLGDHPDVPRPVLDTREEYRARQARYREKNREALRHRMNARRAAQRHMNNPFQQLIAYGQRNQDQPQQQRSSEHDGHVDSSRTGTATTRGEASADQSAIWGGDPWRVLTKRRVDSLARTPKVR